MEDPLPRSDTPKPVVGFRRFSLSLFFVALVTLQATPRCAVSAAPTSTVVGSSYDQSTVPHCSLTEAVGLLSSVLDGRVKQGKPLQDSENTGVSQAVGVTLTVEKTSMTKQPFLLTTLDEKRFQTSTAQNNATRRAMPESLHCFASVEQLLKGATPRLHAENDASGGKPPEGAAVIGTVIRRLLYREKECKGRVTGLRPRGLASTSFRDFAHHEQRAIQRRRMEDEVLSRRWERRTQQLRQRWKEASRKRSAVSTRPESVHFRRVTASKASLRAPRRTFPAAFLGLPHRTLRDIDPERTEDFAGDFDGTEDDVTSLPDRALEQQTRKTYVRYSGGYVSAYACTMIGRRPTDEDAIVVNITSRKLPNACFEAIFDGHGGHEAAQFAAKNAARYFGHLDSFDAQSITNACLSLDAAILRSPEIGHSGATGVFVFIERILEPKVVTVVGREIVPEHAHMFRTAAELICQDEAKRGLLGSNAAHCPPRPPAKKVRLGVGENLFKLTVANIGDSRALLIHESGKYTRLSRDHKPSVAAEAQRIMDAGGFIDFSDTFRVNGIMSLSRAFGDADMKQNPHQPLNKQLITAVPDVRSFVARTSDILLVACDGLYEPREMTPQYVASFIHNELRHDGRPEKVLFRLLDAAFDLQSGDNISAVLTFFRERRAVKEIKKTAIVPGKSEVHDF